MNVDVFIMTYAADAEWFKYCVATARKNLGGIRDIVAGCPTGVPSVVETCQKYGVRLIQFEHRHPGHLQQQVYKPSADRYCFDPDWICFFDSDCIFNRPANISELFRREKPLLIMKDWPAGEEHHWRVGTERFAKCDIRMNFMVTHGMCFRPAHLQAMRRWLIEAYGNCEQIILDQWDSNAPTWFPKRELGDVQPAGKPTFSEFLFMGHFCWHRFYEDFCWWNILDHGTPFVGADGQVNDVFKQYWSHWDVTPEIRAELEAML